MEPITAWSNIQLEHLFYAYRKAKADCFFERVSNVADEFIEYEKNLPSNLNKLLQRLQNGEIEILLKENLGRPRVIAKKLSTKPHDSQDKNTGHIFFSDPERAFDSLVQTSDLIPEFRLIGHFPTEMHILSALWVNLIGHKFDGALSSSAYGSRLRRYRPVHGSPKGSLGEYHLEAIGSFHPYFEPYKKWRENGFKAIRKELEDDQEGEQSVIAISFDIKSYYHNIDPSFAANPEFHKWANIKNLTEWDRLFTLAFVEALKLWAKKVREAIDAIDSNLDTPVLGGIPIGLSFTHVIANVLLVGLDREIKEGLTPIFYGRYVDDMFLVLRDPKTISNVNELIGFIRARIKSFETNPDAKDEIVLKFPNSESFIGDSKLILQQSKQKTFFLHGQAGLDLLDNIQTQIRSVSSERRQMPSVDRLEEMASAKILTAAGQASEEADTLRRADGLAVRRLSWSVQLRAIEILARDLNKNDWRDERKKFYQFAYSHILRADKILDHIDYLPRLLSIAVSLDDWADAKQLYDTAILAQKRLEQATKFYDIKINGITIKSDLGTIGRNHIWAELRKVTRSLAKDAIVRSLLWDRATQNEYPLTDTARSLCESVGLETDPKKLYLLALNYREADWARIPYKEHLRWDANRQRPLVKDEEALYLYYTHIDKLREFLKDTLDSDCPRINKDCLLEKKYSLLPYLYPTRPYTTQEISLLLPHKCVFSHNSHISGMEWANYVRAMRGIWVWDRETNDELVIKKPKSKLHSPDTYKIITAHLGDKRDYDKVLLGITSLETLDSTWKEAASGNSDISRQRYERIERLVNQVIHSRPKPTHLLLPELSLPERWIKTVSSTLLNEGISLIAGLDYHCAGDEIYNEAVLALTDNRLGFPSSVQIRQPKILPAAKEEIELQVFGKKWKDFSEDQQKKRLYIHHGFCFGLLICSELQNVQHRLDFQGHVDSMMVLAWNKDLETFSALLEAASLDVHAYTALVNNRQYGDSRVRSPAKEYYKRDLCRLRGGKNEYFVVVELDIEQLRAFQSRAIRSPSEADPFKPVPEAFKISGYRKTIPA